MVLDQVRKTIENNRLIAPGDGVILGLSGGPDSLCLFQCLLELREELDFKLCAVHVNHKFRPGAAEADREFVEELCASKGVKCYSFEIDCNLLAREKGLSPEDAGRKARYDSFGRVADILVAGGGFAPDRIKIAVAQNADDQCETMLFRLMRGTGPDGLVGIEYFRMQDDYMVIRPLLDVARADIERFIEEKQLDPRRDETNDKPIYARNRIRLELIPFIKENFNSNFEDALLRLQMLLAQDKDFIYSVLYSEIDGHKGKDIFMTETGSIEIGLDYFNSLHQAIRSRMLMTFLESLGLVQGVSMAHINGIAEIAEKGDTSLMINLPLGYVARVSYGKLILEAAPRKTEKDETINWKLRFEERPVTELIGSERRKDRAVFDADKLREDLGEGFRELIQCRSRRNGDIIRLSVGTRKIKDLFIDMKLPQALRDQCGLVAVGGEVLWIPSDISQGKELGFAEGRYSVKYKVDHQTSRIIEIYVERM